MVFTDPIDVLNELKAILTSDADLNGVQVKVESGVPNTDDFPLVDIVYAGMVLDEQGLGAGTGPFNWTLNVDLYVYDMNLGEPLAARRLAFGHTKSVRTVLLKAANRDIGNKVLSSTVTEMEPINVAREGSHVAGERLRLECLVRETS